MSGLTDGKESVCVHIKSTKRLSSPTHDQLQALNSYKWVVALDLDILNSFSRTHTKTTTKRRLWSVDQCWPGIEF